MKRSNLYLVIITLCLSYTPFFVKAQNGATDIGNEGGKKYFSPTLSGLPVLSITPDATSAGMAELGITATPSAYSLYHNVALLPRIGKDWGISLSYTPWMAEVAKDMSLSYLTGYYTWQCGRLSYAVGGSFRYFHIGKALAFPSVGEPIQINPYELAIDAGFGVGFGQHWSVGAALRYAHSDYNITLNGVRGAAGTLLFDISGAYITNFSLGKVGEGTLRTGIALNNIGNKLTYDGGATYLFSPTILKVGVGLHSQMTQEHGLGLHLGMSKLLVPTYPNLEGKDDAQRRKLLADYYNQSATKAILYSFADTTAGVSEEIKEFVWALGVEYSYNKNIFLRTGYIYQHPEKGTGQGFSFGLGLIYADRYKLDMAYFSATDPNSPLNRTLRLTFGVDF